MAYRSSAAWATGGESVLYLGRHYRLKVHAGETGAAKLRGGWLHAPAPHGAERTEHLRTALVAPGFVGTRRCGCRNGPPAPPRPRPRLLAGRRPRPARLPTPSRRPPPARYQPGLVNPLGTTYGRSSRLPNNSIRRTASKKPSPVLLIGKGPACS